MDNTINEILRNFLENKLNENTQDYTFKLGKYVEKQSPEFVQLLQKANTYLFENKKFTQGMVDYLGNFEPLEDQEVIDPATMPINFIVEHDEENGLIQYNKIQDSLKEFQKALGGKKFLEQGYTLGFSVGMIQPVGDLFHLAQRDDDGLETAGGSFIVLRVTVVCIITKDIGIGNDVDYFIAQQQEVGSSFSLGDAMTKFDSVDGFVGASFYVRCSYRNLLNRQVFRTDQGAQENDIVLTADSNGKIRIIKGVTTPEIIESPAVFELDDIVEIVYSDNKLVVNGFTAYTGTLSSPIFGVDLILLGLGFEGTLFELMISNESITSLETLNNISDGTIRFDDVVTPKIKYVDPLIEDRLMINEAPNPIETYNLDISAGVTRVRKFSARETVIPITRGHSKVKMVHNYHYIGEETSKNINKTNGMSDDLAFLINKTNGLSKQFIKELHSAEENQNNVYEVTIRYFDDDELTFSYPKLIEKMSGDNTLGSTILINATFILAGDEL